jgi:Holliday junction resolvase RusA-like endonuclease
MIRTLAMEAMGVQPPMEGPVEMTLFIVMPIPQSWPAWKREMAVAGQIMPTTKPDSDNVEKAVKDALNGVVWGDDAQVVSTVKAKLYAGGEFRATGVYVSAQQLPAMPAQHKHKPEAAR